MRHKPFVLPWPWYWDEALAGRAWPRPG